MYSDQDLDAAVAAGAISAEAAAGLRAFVGRRQAAPDEEQFRLLTGFNDIFVSIAILVFLIAVAWIAGGVKLGLGGAAVAVLSWGLAEYFVRRRRMALPAIVLTFGYAGGCITVLITVFSAIFGGAAHDFMDGASPAAALIPVCLAGLVYAHWRRFHVPITVAVCASACLGGVLVLLLVLVPALQAYTQLLLFLCGLALFVLAMFWDIRDPRRNTRRTDIAFWLHLVAAPILVHAAFGDLRGFLAGGGEVMRAVAVLAVYLGLTAIALVIDRRALLTAALAYVLYAMSLIIRDAGSPALSFALSSLVIGATLLLLSAFWHRARRALVSVLSPGIQRFVPPVAV
jgi:hypothetical protein